MTVSDAATVVSPGSMATDFVMSRATPGLAHRPIGPAASALGHGLDLAEAGAGQLREVARPATASAYAPARA